MIQCGQCGLYNLDTARECSKCGAELFFVPPKLLTHYQVGPQKAKTIRDKALSALVIGLLMKVYWGGYGPWPVIDLPLLAGIRPWLEAVLLYGGGLAYLLGWFLKFI